MEKINNEILVPEVQLVVFRLGDEEFGVEILEVREIVRMMDITSIPQAPGFIKGVINLRGQIVTVIDLARQFGLEQKGNVSDKPEGSGWASGSPNHKTRIIVAVTSKKIFGLIVDEVFEVVKISREDINPTPEIIQTEIHKDYLKGVGRPACAAGKERLIILLDLEKVANPTGG